MEVADGEGLLAGEPRDVAALLAGLRSASCAVVRLPLPATREMRSLDAAASAFFALPEAVKAEHAQLVCIRAAGAHKQLLGWRRPSPAKELVRYFAGRAPTAGVRAPRAVRSLVRHARVAEGRLCALMTSCLRAVLADAGVHASAREVRYAVRDNRPLDLFRYHNRDHGTAPVDSNCSAHVDRGILHAIVAARVEGLECYDARAGRFFSPERAWPTTMPLDHVIVLANAELQQLSHSESSNGGWPDRAPRYRACVHRVVGAARPRLSISCELRACAEREGGSQGWLAQLPRAATRSSSAA